ncbi:MAG: hypothetical protein R6V61_03460, partial [Wenzhouxiangellaceae bacterium]
LQQLLERLDQADLVHQDGDGAWHLSTDLDEVTLADLYRCMPLVLPLGELDDFPERRDTDAALLDALHEIEHAAGPLLQRPLKSFVNTNSGPARHTAA